MDGKRDYETARCLYTTDRRKLDTLPPAFTTLQQILGHASIQMTMRYAHLSDTHMAAKMAMLSNGFPIENRTIPADTAPLTAPPQIQIPANIL